jgi:Ca-activated chloride channel homolog
MKIIEENVKINVLTQKESYICGISTKSHVLFEIKTEKKDEIERPPIELSIVMDTSGSMSGSKLKFAKKAVRKCIKHLTKEDTLNLVTFDSSAKIIFANGDLSDKKSLEEITDKITSGGSTKISNGLELGYKLLENSKSNNTKRIFLFSDGQDDDKSALSKLCQQAEGYTSKGVSISTFGIGSDFDENLMRKVSVSGQGDYYFLDTDKSIPANVSKAIHGLMSLTGSGSCIKIRGKNGVMVKRFVTSDHVDLTEGYKFGDLHSNNLKQVLIEIEVSPSKEEKVIGLTYELSYLSDENKQCSVKGTHEFDFTEDESKVKKDEDKVMISLLCSESEEIVR